MKHNIFFDKSSVPPDAKILGLWVRVPRIVFATDDELLDEYTLSELKPVYVQLSDEEWNAARGNQVAIDALGQALGPEVAEALGGYVKGWSSPHAVESQR